MATVANAQINKKVTSTTPVLSPKIISKSPTNTIPSQTTTTQVTNEQKTVNSTPAPPQPQAQTLPASAYKLTKVRVKVHSGADKKESPSEVVMLLGINNQQWLKYCVFAQ
ncbi:MAG: hypothetical protein IT214_01400 [Chitinophagaceae bacterium]|nr:hypothetical protein [Chitinophagaceae bacterium]